MTDSSEIQSKADAVIQRSKPAAIRLVVFDFDGVFHGRQVLLRRGPETAEDLQREGFLRAYKTVAEQCGRGHNYNDVL